MPGTYYVKEGNILWRNKAGDRYPTSPDQALHKDGWGPLYGQLTVSADAHPDMTTRGTVGGGMDPLAWTTLSEISIEEAKAVAVGRGLPTEGWEEDGEEAYSEALALALEFHGDQIRDSAQDGPGIPYMAHLMSVTALVLEHGGDEDEAIAALLHDGPEDQGGQETLDDIRDEFGDRVADIVEGCTDTFDNPKPPWRARKELYIKHLRETASPSVFLVSMSDKVHNLRSILNDYREIGEKLWDRFTGKRDGTLWYYGELLKVYQGKAPARCALLVEEMEGIYAALAALAEHPQGGHPSRSGSAAEPARTEQGVGDWVAALDAAPLLDAASLSRDDIPRLRGIYAVYRRGEDQPLYIGKATGKLGLRGRIWSQHLNPKYLEHRTEIWTPEDVPQAEKGVTHNGRPVIEKSAFRKSLARQHDLTPGQPTIDYIRANFELRLLTFENTDNDEIRKVERSLIVMLQPSLNRSGTRKSYKRRGRAEPSSGT